jgi:hypothetical protein
MGEINRRLVAWLGCWRQECSQAEAGCDDQGAGDA